MVFFENEGNYQYKPSIIQGASLGRWIVMDGQDFDRDGDMDLLVGSLMFEVEDDEYWINYWLAQKVPYLLLENKTN